MAGGFESLGLMPELLRAVDELHWNLPTDIQDEAIPLIMGGGDVMAAAETGSGKTAAFCLPMIQCVYERLRELEQVTGAVQKTKTPTTPGDTTANAATGTGGSSTGESSASASADNGLHYDVRMSEVDKDNLLAVSSDGLTATGQAEKQ